MLNSEEWKARNKLPPSDKQLRSERGFQGFLESRMLPMKEIVFGDPCPYCGNKADSIEHVVPRSEEKGLMFNTVGACKLCNNSRKSVPFLIWWGQETGQLTKVDHEISYYYPNYSR